MTTRTAPTVEIDGAALRRLREAAMLSQAALGDLAGMNMATISRLETSRRQMVYRGTIRRLAEALGVEPRALLKGDRDGNGV